MSQLQLKEQAATTSTTTTATTTIVIVISATRATAIKSNHFVTKNVWPKGAKKRPGSKSCVPVPIPDSTVWPGSTQKLNMAKSGNWDRTGPRTRCSRGACSFAISPYKVAHINKHSE